MEGQTQKRCEEKCATLCEVYKATIILLLLFSQPSAVERMVNKRPHSHHGRRTPSKYITLSAYSGKSTTSDIFRLYTRLKSEAD